MAIEIASVSDMFKAGITEDGADYIGLVWYVLAELDNGQRFAHGHRFHSTKAEYCEEIGCMVFPDNSEQAETESEQLAERIRNHVAAGGKLDLGLWREVDPRYGSTAYSDLEITGYFKERERREG